MKNIFEKIFGLEFKEKPVGDESKTSSLPKQTWVNSKLTKHWHYFVALVAFIVLFFLTLKSFSGANLVEGFFVFFVSIMIVLGIFATIIFWISFATSKK